MSDIRSLAVEIVDGSVGYTAEFSASSESHRVQYELAEHKIRTFLCAKDVEIARLRAELAAHQEIAATAAEGHRKAVEENERFRDVLEFIADLGDL
jgi:hypothetical protein